MTEGDLEDKSKFFALDISSKTYVGNTKFTSVGYGDPDGSLSGASDDKDIAFENIPFPESLLEKEGTIDTDPDTYQELAC